ncbi:Holliday junction ATP-dependent DNA helicase RuvB [Polystyrenella longa]|uniref:Holliday junction ATP-dependent DNA helicase RuvB n=1 Tax=Polystyrenella longa TaxID=2528007 RepID=A0A518CU77_9PLAN|nr:Holliday junction DNA helicase RuvB C-terminal domain-containing protein [Polystyrenella longa]QDU82782.1 Holliday junction ATP-dependent DNA helicase RuvB [Polystyrenella longa]
MNNDIRSSSPSSLAHLIGQTRVIDQVTVALDACQMDGKIFDHSLLTGGPGLGKTALAQVIASEMASDFHEVLGQSITTPSDLNAVLLSARDKSIVFIDEAHELKKEYQTALYLALDKRKVIVSGGKSPKSIALADFTLLLATTDEHCLLQPLRDRMRLTLRYEYYSDDELFTLCKQRALSLGWSVENTIFPLIAIRSRGTPRIVIRLLQSCHRVCRSEGEHHIVPDHLFRACELEGIDHLGLDVTEQKYLEIVSNGATRLNVVASLLGLPTRTVSNVTESFLIRSGLITKDDQGKRILTQSGQDHLSELRTNSV